MALSVLPTITEVLGSLPSSPLSNHSSSTHSELKLHIEAIEEGILNGPYSDTYKLYRQLTYTINQTINLIEDCEDKLELLRNLQLELLRNLQLELLRNLQLELFRDPNTVSNDASQPSLKLLEPNFLKVNYQGCLSLTRHAKTMLRYGSTHVANCIINQIITLCDTHFFHGYVVPLYMMLLEDHPFSLSAVTPNPFLQIYLQSFIKICTQIITHLQRINHCHYQYLSAHISTELEMITELRRELWIKELEDIEN